MGRLSAKQRASWRPIACLILAEDDRGRPIHATLRTLWDAVAASGHEVHVELAEPSLSRRNAAGLFEIESVRPDGRIVARVRLDLTTIDRAAVGDPAHHGFARFQGLTRAGRHAEVLGHELGHAVWALADPVRARRLLSLQRRLATLTRALLKSKGKERVELRRRLSELAEESKAIETPARVTEARVWEELVASRVLPFEVMDERADRTKHARECLQQLKRRLRTNALRVHQAGGSDPRPPCAPTPAFGTSCAACTSRSGGARVTSYGW